MKKLSYALSENDVFASVGGAEWSVSKKSVGLGGTETQLSLQSVVLVIILPSSEAVVRRGVGQYFGNHGCDEWLVGGWYGCMPAQWQNRVMLEWEFTHGSGRTGGGNEQ